MLNQVNLGLSGYHGSFITIVAGSSDVALGLEKIINNHDVGGINNILRGTVGTFSAPFDLAIQGIADKLGKSESVESLVDPVPRVDSIDEVDRLKRKPCRQVLVLRLGSNNS